MRKNVKKLALHAAGLAAVAAVAFASLGGNGITSAHAETARPGQHLTDRMADLREGSRGQAVKNLQQQLNQRGHRLAVDGVFGPLTENAVKDFQRAHRLSADGIAGPSPALSAPTGPRT
ncbi:peptidoglycan-binding domain-containing protein [Streptomyces goshikiensis]|uniref:peptidoglycan-binding domain-containing protein n=1 Tax=Streptomyces goshikiensis TaxID=1942 RepID=UPI0036BC86F6